MLHVLARNLFAVDLEHAGAAAADTAYVVKGERAHSEAVVLKVELDRVLAWRQRVQSLPARALHVEEVIQEYGLVLQQIETVAAEAAALGDDHAFGTALGDVDLRREVERGVEYAWSVAVRRTGDLAGPSERRTAGGKARTGRDDPGRDGRVER